MQFTWPAPINGLVRSGALVKAAPSAAEVLNNFWPTAEGARVRGGAEKTATIPTIAKSLFKYRSGNVERMFAATATDIYDVSAPADVDVAETPVVSGLSGGRWSVVQFSTSGGEFTFGLNGADHAHYYNGTTWLPITDEATNSLDYDALTADFAVGETVTGGTSGATAEILSILPSSATAGALALGAITGAFIDNEALTSASGAATSDGLASANLAVSITGVTTSDLSFPWAHKERLWFVEENSLSAWYLPVQSIGGAASKFPLNSVFDLGGALLFGGSWSVDAGDGMDDVLIFVTTEGEVAAYQGTDPSDAAAWALVGVYKIGRPLSKDAWFNSGGDVMVLTEDGVIPISEALQKDRAALQAAAITYPIEALWQRAVANRSLEFNFTAALWPSRTSVVIGLPEQDGVAASLVANTRTGAWATISGWDVQCCEVFNDALYFATSDGVIAKADEGGTDLGEPYSCQYVPKFQEMGSPEEKHAVHARGIWRSTSAVVPQMVGFANYEIGSYPASGNKFFLGTDVWGTGSWGASVWGGRSPTQHGSDWQSVAGSGFALSVGWSVTSNQTEKPDMSISATVLRYERGRAI